MIRVYSIRKRLIPLGLILLLGFSALATLFFQSEPESIGYEVFGLSLLLALVGAIIVVGGSVLPLVLFEFDEYGVKSRKFKETQVPWSDVHNFFHMDSSGRAVSVHLDIPKLSAGQKPFYFEFVPGRTDPHFKTFDEFRVAVEELYGAPIFDLEALKIPTTLERFLYFAILALIVGGSVTLFAGNTTIGVVLVVGAFVVWLIQMFVVSRHLKSTVRNRPRQPPGTV